jgi:monoamine oxidase
MARSQIFRTIRDSLRAQNLTPEREVRVGRRDFLKGSCAAMALGLPFAPLRSGLSPRTVIIGAGLAGLGAACRLRELAMPYQIFEASTRIGGRVWTMSNFNSDGQFGEFGGELIDSNHTYMMTWARKFGLELDNFQSRARLQSDYLYFINGQRHYSAELVEGLKPLSDFAQLAIAEVRRGIPEDVYLGHWHRNHPGVVKYDRMSLAEFLDSVPDLEPWIRAVVENGYVAEFGSEAFEQTALNFLEMFQPGNPDGLFGSSDESMRIRGGNGRLLEKMFARACPFGQSDSRMHVNHRLVRIRELGREIELTFSSGHSHRTVYADRVICTVPFSVLRNVDGIRRLNLSPIKRRSILEIGYGTNSKVTMDFKKKFWHSGAVCTSAGIATDLESQSFWDSSRLQAGTRGVLTNYRGGRAGALVDESFVPSIVSDLGEIYDGPGPRDNFAQAHVTNWSRSPFQLGSYSCLRPGQTTRLWGSNHEPELDGRLIFAGEHTSLQAVGFMEGALSSGVLAAERIRNSVAF